MNKFSDTFEYKLIYIFTINDESHKDLLKIGDATIKTNKNVDELFPNCRDLNQAALARIKTYTNTAGIDPVLLYTELAIKQINNNGNISVKAFRDHDVHRILENSGFGKATINGTTGKEWYKVDINTAISAIKAVKENKQNLSDSKLEKYNIPIIFRPEQELAIKQTLNVFKNNNRMLWNAKMRFGKTLTALEVIKQAKFKKSIIITHRPVVDKGWYEDFNKIFNDTDEYVYGSKNMGYDLNQLENTGKNYVYFASMQDLRGSEQVGGNFNKNKEIFEQVWDLVIIDEAHEGTTTALGDDVVKKIVKGNNTKFLALSGTPFNILTEYDESNIYTWDYIMEQSQKANWPIEHFGDSNPYDDLPQLKIYTYDLGKIINNAQYDDIEDKAFNFREFFRVWTGDKNIDKKDIPSGCNVGDFVHENDIMSFLNLITKSDDESNYPYSTKEYRDLFKHSLWMLPGVKEARALSTILQNHPIFNGFTIVNVAGDGDEDVPANDALKMVRKAIDESGDAGYTITLSCGKLTTGVTVPEWTAVMMLSGSYSTSAANYLQTIFRVQSPCNKNGKVKTNGYVFDFAPDRTLKMVAEAVAISTKAGKTTGDDKVVLGEFLNYCPVISLDGTQMITYSTNKLLQQLKRAYAERALKNGFDDVNIYNDELLKLDGVAIEEFNKLKGIIGTSKPTGKINEIEINNQGLTNEEIEIKEQIERKLVKERTPEEQAKLDELKDRGKNKKNAISILRGISIRMPLLIYGADVGIDEDIDISQLTKIVDDSSWEEFMPEGVTKEIFDSFIKYYDSEIFIEAGRKIRKTVKNADSYEPLERIEKITQLFNYFKNPDKETVLTPWRVVNMHMSEALGGYNFYDENFENVLDEPVLVDHGTITAGTITDTEAKILEINSKTGLYPLYVTYSIYKSKCNKEPDITDERKNELWNETVAKNIFIVCKTPMAKSITKRTLIGFKNNKVNAHYFDDLINYLKNKPDKFVERILKRNYWDLEGSEKMKFNAVVGNPPYQEEGESTRKPPVYNYFYDASFKLSDIVSLITPGRFLFDAGQTPKEWNKKMLNDEHFKVIKYFSDSKDVFSSVDIKGGVAITLRNENDNYGAIKVFAKHEILNDIMKKISNNENIQFLDSIVSSRGNYRFSEEFFNTFSYAPQRLGKGTGNMIVSNVFEKLPECFKNINEINDIAIYGRENNERKVKYINNEYVIDNDYTNTFNVVLPKSNGTGEFGECLSTPVICKPKQIATDTFISIGTFESEFESKALLKYLKTKFLRCLLGIKKVTQDNPKSVWTCIPIQDFSDNSDILWNKTVDEIDKQLFKKYGLTESEIDFIESNIKEMK